MTNEPKKKPQGPQHEDWVGPDHDPNKHIGRMLKGFYDEVARQQVPDKFLELLKQLEAAEPRKR